MTTSLGGSSSYPAEGEMVGSGARRKNPHRLGITYGNNCGYTRNQSSAMHSQHTHNSPVPQSRPKYEKRHIYTEISLLGDEIGTHLHIYSTANDSLMIPNENGLPHNNTISPVCNKPKIPPKPTKYVLRDKRHRHVYQKIVLPHERDQRSPPPPIPAKPMHLKLKMAQDQETPPPLPPRIANREAIKKRHDLDKEYFVNLRKSVDDGLLELAEEGDLPVPIIHDLEGSGGMDSQNSPDSLNGRTHEISVLGATGGDPTSESLHQTAGQDRPSSPNGLTPQVDPAFPRFSNLPTRLSSESESEHSTFIPSSGLEKGLRSFKPSVQLVENLQLLKKCGWYWGNMSWQEAESLLAGRGEGAFLMRDSLNAMHLLTVTVCSAINTIHHIRVEYSGGKFQLYEPSRSVSRSAEQCVRHSNIKQFIELAMKHSMSGSFLYFVKPKTMGEPPILIRLLTPVSRLARMKSLQYHCRMTVRNCISVDLLSRLVVPPRIRDYLSAGPYYDPSEEL